MNLFLGFEGCLQLHETKRLPKAEKTLIFIKAEKMTTIYHDVHYVTCISKAYAFFYPLYVVLIRNSFYNSIFV